MAQGMTWRRGATLILAALAVALLAMGAFATMPAQAKVKVVGWAGAEVKTQTVTAEPMDSQDQSVSLDVTSTDGKAVKIKSVKSSKNAIAKPSYEKGSFTFEVLYGHKPGKATITIKTNRGTARFTFKVTYTCPVKSLKIGGSNFTKQLQKDCLANAQKSLKKKTLTVKAKKGWVITSVTTIKDGMPIIKDVDNKASYTAKVSLAEVADTVTVAFANTKTDSAQSVCVIRSFS